MSRLTRIRENPRTPPHWARALVLAECDWGDLWLPCLNRRHVHPAEWWDRRFNPWRPGHWPYVLTTWLTGWLIHVEGA